MQRIKRLLDILLSLIAILLLTPIWILLAISIYIEDSRPIFFKQSRVGHHQKIFTIYKFRSMYVNHIPPLELGAVKHNHTLVTRVGHFIRRFKLDETLQLFNILKGEMSLVGPRPCLPERLKTMNQTEIKRFHLLPGLTGWAEVNGNVELTWEEQLLLDLWYISHWSLFLDFKIILKTFIVVLFGSRKNIEALYSAAEDKM